MKQNVVIIGAGIGGLATGALLGKMGYRVTILEKETTIGGYSKELKLRGYSFSMGPMLYLMPDAFERYFSLFKKKPETLFRFKKIDPQCRFFFSQSEWVDLHSKPRSSKKIRELMDQAESQYDIVADEILYNHNQGLLNLLNPSTLSELSKLPMMGSMEKYVLRSAKTERLKNNLLYLFPLLGLDPKQVPPYYFSLLYKDLHDGLRYPTGGMHVIVSALERLCKQHGVTIKTGTEVEHMRVERGRVKQVVTSSRMYDCDIVISNANYAFTEFTLLDNRYRNYDMNYWKKKTSGTITTVLHMGITGKLKTLKHVNIIDNSMYVLCPTKTDPPLAPKGDECLSIIALNGMDADAMVAKLEAMTGEAIKKRIKIKKCITYPGSAMGPRISGLRASLLRPSNKSKKVKNLYFVGQHTSPGAGVPLCLISSQLVAERIRREQ